MKGQLYCTLCKTLSANNVHYICNSGHVVCDICQNNKGNFQNNLSIKDNSDRVKRNTTQISLQKKEELAGGDNKYIYELKEKSKSEGKFSVKAGRASSTIKSEKKESPCSSETSVRYRNVNFSASNTSTNDICDRGQLVNGKGNIVTALLNESETKEVQRLPNEHATNHQAKIFLSEHDMCFHHGGIEAPILNSMFFKPVSCPVGECSKMIAITSVFLHFYFDHTKVPLLSADASTNALNISIDAQKISETSRCIALLIQNKHGEIVRRNSSYSEIQQSKNIAESLIMTAKLSITPIKCGVRMVTKNVTTQTNIEDTLYYGLQNKVTLRNTRNKNNNLKTERYKMTFNNNEVFLFWVCELNCTKSYTITVSGDDWRFAHSYSGDGVHIRSSQDACSVYNRAECLMIRGAALNKMLDTNDRLRLRVIINY